MRRHVYEVEIKKLGGEQGTLNEAHLADSTISYDDTYNKSDNQRSQMD